MKVHMDSVLISPDGSINRQPRTEATNHADPAGSKHSERSEQTRKIPPKCRGWKTDGENATVTLLRMLRPCAKCTSYKRFGSRHDGGYVLCADALGNVTAGYSFGIDGNDDWGADISHALNVPVFEFDCWHTKRPRCSDGTCKLFFREECLSQYEGFQADKNQSSKEHNAGKIARSLREHIAGNPPEGVLDEPGAHFLVKIDVEGAEWNSLKYAASDEGGVLQRMSQIVVEFHLMSFVECHAYFASVLKDILSAGFVVAHIHDNNWGPMDILNNGRYMISEDLEVTFVNRMSFPAGAPVQSACQSEQDLLPEDSTNAWELPELPLAELPNELPSDRGLLERDHVTQCRFFCKVTQAYLEIGPDTILIAALKILMATLVLVLAFASTSALHEAYKEALWTHSTKAQANSCAC